MKTLNALWKTEAELIYGANFGFALDLVLAAGTEFYATRDLSIVAQVYQPIIVNFGEVVTRYTPLGQGRPITSRCTVAIDNRIRFGGGPSTRFSSKLTGTEPEGAVFTLRSVKINDTGQRQVILAGRVMTVQVTADVVTLVLGDDLAWLEQTQGQGLVGTGDFPYARNTLWFSPVISDIGKPIPLGYGEILEDVEGVWTKQRIDRLRADVNQSATEIPIFRTDVWDPGGGSGWLMSGVSTNTFEKFRYTGVDEVNRKLTGVTRGVIALPGNSRGPFSFNTANDDNVWPSLDNDLDPSAIVFDGDVSSPGAASLPAGEDVRLSSRCEARWGENTVLPVDITLNGDSTISADLQRADGVQLFMNQLGTGNTNRLRFHNEWMWYSDASDPSRNFLNLFDFNDGTFHSFGDQANSGRWSFFQQGTQHDIISNELPAPFSTLWDDQLEGKFRWSRHKTDQVHAWALAWQNNRPTVIGFEIKYRVATRGTKTVANCRFQMHLHGQTDVPADETAFGNKFHIMLDLDLTARIPTDGIGVIQTVQHEETGLDTGNFGDGTVAAPFCRWQFGIDYSGGGTDYVIDIISIQRLWSGAFPDVLDPVDAGGNDTITADVGGVLDDALGTFTGTPNALITNPADVRRHYVQVVGGVPVARIDVTSFTDERSKYVADEHVIGSTEIPRDFGPVLAEMDFASQAWTFCSQGLVRSQYRETVATLIAAAVNKSLTKDNLASIGGPALGDVEIMKFGVRVMPLPVPDRPRLPHVHRIDHNPSSPPVMRSQRVGADDISNTPSADLDPVLSTTVGAGLGRMVGARVGDISVSDTTTRQVATALSQASRDAFGSRRGEVMPDIPWLTSVSVANKVVGNLNKWREDPRLILSDVKAYTEQWELEPGDLVTVEWKDEETGFVWPQLDGSRKFLVLPTPAMEPSVGRMGRVGLTLIQVDL